jgi:hypothetical protein
MRGERAAAAEVMMVESATGTCVPGEAVMRKSAVSEFVMTQSMTCERVSGKTVSRKSMAGELMMASHRVSGETPTLAASVMPTVMMPSTVVMMADPTPSCPSATLAATCPTVLTKPAMTIPAVVAVTDEFKVGPAAEALTVPATIHSPTGAIKALVSRIAPGERRSVARATHGPWAPVCTETAWTKAERFAPGSTAGTRSTTPRRPSAFTSASLRSTRFRSTWTGLPGDLMIRTAIAAHFAAFLAVSPIGVTRGTLVSRVAPFRSLLTFAVDRTTTLAHAIFVSTIFIPASITLFAGLIVAPRGLVRTMPSARGSVGSLLRPAVTACRTTLLGAGVVAVRVFVRGVGHFVRSNFAYWIGSPTVLRRKLQCGRCRDPTEKHQRITAHRTFPCHLECRLLLRIDAVTGLGSHPALAPNGRFPSAVGG